VKTITKVVYYRARGLGEFPIDMLRYDDAFIVEEIRSGPSGLEGSRGATYVVAFPSYKVKGSGAHAGCPTRDRWRSYTWSVVPIDEPDARLGDTWVTRDKEHGGRWVTLEEWLKS
jgi:hypothetical protein